MVTLDLMHLKNLQILSAGFYLSIYYIFLTLDIKKVKYQEIFILLCFNMVIFEGLSFYIFFIHYQLNTNFKNLTWMLYQKIICMFQGTNTCSE